MKNNANLLIAAVFMMGFLVFWESFVTSRYNTRPQAPVSSSAAPVEKGKMTPAELSAATAQPNPTEESLTILETSQTKLSFSSRGARVVSWQIKERDHWVELIEPEKRRTVSPLETFGNVNFAVTMRSETEALFTANLPNGAVLKKEVRMAAQPPFHAVSLSFSNPTKNPITVDSSLPLGNGVDKHVVGTPYDEKQESATAAETRVVALSDRVRTWKPGFIFSRTIDTTDAGSYKWAGVDNHHFLIALLPVSGSLSNLKIVADREHSPFVSIPVSMVLKPGDALEQSYHVYGGPKDYNELKKIGHGLEQSVDFGFFGVIAKLLLKTLNFFDSLTGNYGWAIILLTFVIQVLMFPITKKNLQHSLRMREFQPQLKKLQEQFKGDPKRLQVETFNLYKKNGMKFMGMEGCFPILLQIPVFIAFYSTLSVAYELRGAPWILWIKDLGVYDPYYVLPIIMGAGMFLQQKLTAVVADPAQARMMMFMPIIFTVMFIHVPAGLVLYWCVNSLVTILIQMLLGIHKQTTSQPAT